MTHAGLPGFGVWAKIMKASSGRWKCAVALPTGEHTHAEFDTFEQAMAGRYAMVAELIDRPPPVRGEAVDGPRGRENVA